MTPLLPNKIPELLTRIDQASGGELFSVTMNAPQNFTIELSVQDKNRGYDWINIAFEVDGIIDAHLIDDTKLSLVDMSEGISICHEDGLYALGIGQYNSIDALKSATLYLIGNALKYEERPFQN